MSDIQAAVRNLAVLAALKKVIDKRERELKTTVASLKRGTIYEYVGDEQDDDQLLGSAQVKKPRQMAPRVIDEDQAVAWAVENFGESAMSTRPTLSEQGLASVKAAALAGTEVPGVEVPEPIVSAPTFVPGPNVLALVRKMWTDGQLTAADLPNLEGSK